MNSPVMAALNQGRTAFERWCILQGIQSMPCQPGHIAAFVRDHAPMGPAKTFEQLRAISEAHLARGLADPCAGGVVAKAMNEISGINPPRSWPKAEKERFLEIPYDLQLIIERRERDRDTEMRRKQNEAGDLRAKLLTLQKTIQGKTDDTDQKIAAA